MRKRSLLRTSGDISSCHDVVAVALSEGELMMTCPGGGDAS